MAQNNIMKGITKTSLIYNPITKEEPFIEIRGGFSSKMDNLEQKEENLENNFYVNINSFDNYNTSDNDLKLMKIIMIMTI